jgi:hypothetical protein
MSKHPIGQAMAQHWLDNFIHAVAELGQGLAGQ